MKVVVLCGGNSAEQDASRQSAKSVSEALESLGHTTCTVEYSPYFAAELQELSPDIVFHIVQGKNHGDGAVQSVLELLGVPYVGSRPYAAALINHKTLCKKLWRAEGIPTPEFFELSRQEFSSGGFDGFLKKAHCTGLSLPMVVKAPTQGSRYGMAFVRDEASFKQIEDIFRFDEVLLVERFVPGRFITQGMLEIDGEMTLLPPVEIIDNSEDEFKLFYGAELPYRDPELSPEELEELNHISLEAASVVDASGFARLDYHISGGELFLLEINAVPGLRRHYSDLLKCANAAGYDYETLITMLLATAK